MTVGRSETTKKTPDLDYIPIPFYVRLMGVGISCVLETIGALPLDAFKNRRINDPYKVPAIFSKQSPYLISPAYVIHLKKNLIGYDYASSRSCAESLAMAYRGFSPYFAYKVFNRGLKLGVQPPLMEAMMSMSAYEQLSAGVGASFAKVVTASIAGGVLGVAEVVVNPFDRWKLLCQTDNLSPRVALEKMWGEGLRQQYSGWKETATRNAVGSGTLFATKYLTYQFIGVHDHNNPNAWQSLLSSMVGNGTMIVASHPWDILKVRKQKQDPSKQPSIKQGMMHTLFAIGKNEGINALTVGLLPKLIGSGLKGGLIMSLCEMLVKEINLHYRQQEQQVQAAQAPRPMM